MVQVKVGERLAGALEVVGEELQCIKKGMKRR
jgi:hypothetical protein